MFVILNPHVSDFFVKPISYHLFKRKALQKYHYILEAAAYQGKTIILVDGHATGMLPMGLFLIFPLWLRKWISRIEIIWWLRINKLQDKVKVKYNAKTLDSSYTLFAFAYKIFKSKKGLVKTSNYFSKSIFHLSHYHGFTSSISDALKEIINCQLAADADISNAPFFRQFFSWYSLPILIIPFEIAERFKMVRKFENRYNKAIVTGTFHQFNPENSNTYEQKALKDYIQFTKAFELHPIRKEIFVNRATVSSQIDVFIAPYVEKKGTFSKLFKSLFSQQKKYFSFNIVVKYNEYKFAIIGEEFYNRLPGIGAFEAMCCGCILIGNALCYQGLGLVDGVHFLGYSGKLNDLQNFLSKISKYEERILQNISQQGMEWVTVYFDKKNLIKQFQQKKSF